MHRTEAEAGKGAASGTAWDHTGSDGSNTAVKGLEGLCSDNGTTEALEDESADSCSSGGEAQAPRDRQVATCRCACWCHFQLVARTLLSILEVHYANEQEAAAARVHQWEQNVNVAEIGRSYGGLRAWGVERSKARVGDRAQAQRAGS